MINLSEHEIVEIPTKKYWEVINDICDSLPESKWFLKDRDSLDKQLLGLKIVHIQPAEFNKRNPNRKPINWTDFQTYKFFIIHDKNKYIWAKIKYGI